MSDVQRGFELYCYARAMMLHFNKNAVYDYVKYRGNTSHKFDKFKKSNIRWSFISSASKTDPLNYQQLVYLMFRKFKFPSYMSDFAVGKNLSNILRNKESFDSIINDVELDIKELSHLYEDASFSEVPETGLYPLIVELHKDDVICKETLLLYHSMVEDIFRKETSRDILSWPNEIIGLRSHASLLNYLLKDHQRSYLRDQMQALV